MQVQPEEKKEPSELYAYLNDVMYDTKERRQSLLNEKGYADWQVDSSLSDDVTMTVVHVPSKKVIVVHSGTRVKDSTKKGLKKYNTDDLLTDAFVSVDLLSLSGRYRKSKTLTKTVLEKYKGYTPVVTGYSLGGAIANQIGHELEVESHAFNPGISPLVFKRNFKDSLKVYRKGSAPSQKHHLYLTQGDWISNSGIVGIKGSENIIFNTKQPKAENPHDIKNWYA